MPRPSITMVFNKSARSSRLLEDVPGPSAPITRPRHSFASSPKVQNAPNRAATSASEPATSVESSAISNVMSQDTAPEKRIRKPSKRMIEALQDDLKGSQDKAAPNSVRGKGQESSETQDSLMTDSSSGAKQTASESGHVTSLPVPVPSGISKRPAGLEGQSLRKSPKKKVPAEDFTVLSQTEPSSTSSESPKKAKHKSKPKSPVVSESTETSSSDVEIRRVRSGKRKSAADSAAGVSSDEQSSAGSAKPSRVPAEDPGKVEKLSGTVEQPRSSNVDASRGEESFDVPEITAAAGSGQKKRSKTSSTVQPAAESTFKESPAQSFDLQSAPSPQSSLRDSPAASLTASTSDQRLTARQRAKLYGAEEHLMRLEDPQPKVATAEFQEKREEKNKKRREQAAQKREDLKKEALQKLLKKSGTGKRGGRDLSDSTRKVIQYVVNASGGRILLPEGISVEQVIPHMPKIPPPPRITCGAPGCRNIKKYSCSRTGTPLCSLQCYKVIQAK